MTESRLLIENFYFKQLLNEEVAFNEQYSSLLGDRTQEFFEYYCDGLNAQKELILALECVEISEKILQEKFGDQFAARVAGLGSKANKLVGKLATGAGLGGKLGSLVQNKFDVNVDKDGSVAYINARNKNFTRSLGDYLGQLKTFDNTIPDKIGLVPVQKSGWLKGIAQKGGQILKGGSSLALAGVGLPVAALTGTAFAGVNGLQQLTNKLNEVFDAQWKKIQNTQPVQDFDRLFEEKKQSLRNKLSKTDKEGKETSKILQSVDALAEYAKKNPAKSGIIIALMTATIGLSAGTLGFGILTVTQLPILTGAVAFFLRTGLGLLKGEKASTAVGGALKAAAVGWITGKLISSVVGPIFDNMIKVPQPAILRPDIVDRVTDSTGKGWVHEKVYLYTNYEQHMSGEVTNPGTVLQGFRGQNFYNGQEIRMDIVTTPENANYIQSISDKINKLSEDAWNTFQTGDNAGATAILNKIPTQLAEVKKIINIIANDPNNTKLVNAFKNYDTVMGANADVRAATKAFNDVYLGVTQGVASGVASAAGGAIGAGASVGASGKPPVIKESTKLSDILKKILAEAEAAAPGAVPPVLPGAAPVNPDKLSGNQQDAVANLKKNIEKEIRGYIKDVAKTFKVKGKTTTELLDGLRKEPKAKSAVEIIDSILGEFPKYKLEFPKDVTMDDKEAATPASTIEPAKPADTVKDATDAANKQGAKPADVVASIPDASPDIKKAATDAANTPGATASSVVYAINTFAGKKPMGTTDPSVGGSFTLSSTLAKQLSDVKQNPLVSGTLMPRLQKMMKLDASNPVNIKYVKSLVNTIKNAVMSPANKAALQKQLGGNIAALRKGMLAEDITSGDIAAIMKEINTLIPLLVNITFGLRQSTSKKNTSGTPPSPVKAPPGAVPPVLTGDTPVTEAAEVDSKTLTLNDLRLVKAFLTKVNDLSVSLKSFDPTKATKVTVKPVIGHILDIFDIVNGKIDPTIKINKNIDSMFQGIDILGGDQTESKLKDGVMLKAKRGLFVYVYKYTNGKWFVRGKDKQFTEPVVDEKIIKQLTDLAATGKNDAEQIQKDDEEKDKLKKADDEKAAAEKDTKAGIEKTKSAADATRASATPEKKKKAWDESFRSEYKNYF